MVSPTHPVIKMEDLVQKSGFHDSGFMSDKQHYKNLGSGGQLHKKSLYVYQVGIDPLQ